uniref:Uncharacterized protein n=1 Tax=Cacopsylla melanoneura TaxID=428564 RepID=A0A8D8ZBP9_9HEMI
MYLDLRRATIGRCPLATLVGTRCATCISPGWNSSMPIALPIASTTATASSPWVSGKPLISMFDIRFLTSSSSTVASNSSILSSFFFSFSSSAVYLLLNSLFISSLRSSICFCN